MKREVGIKSSRVKSARPQARAPRWVRGYARRLMNEPSVSRDMLVTTIKSADMVKTTCTALLAELELVENSKRDGAAVQHLNELIECADRKLRAWREYAEEQSEHPLRKNLAAIRCQACNQNFLADRLCDVARKTELWLAVTGNGQGITPAEDVMAEAFDDPQKWMRCPHCASSKVCWFPPSEEDGREVGTRESAVEIANTWIDELKEKLQSFGDGPLARSECMKLVFELGTLLSRGAELDREHEKRADDLKELIREFGLEEGCKRWWKGPALN